MNNPKSFIPSETAMDLIIQGKELTNYHITGVTNLYKIEGKISCELIIRDCVVENLVSHSVEFIHGVKLIESHFYRGSFNYAYFIGGLTIDNCVFDSYLDFEAGGHNQNSNAFSIKKSKFKSFVNFFDCWFQSDVVIINNEFEKGTNLLGNKEEPFRVQFDLDPIIENNTGHIDLDGEGDKIINTIDVTKNGS